jgi:hypothetical protein
MSGCVLRVLGDSFRAEESVRRTRLAPYTVFVKGEPSRSKRRRHSTSGFNCDVSSSESLSEQISDAKQFLVNNWSDLEQLCKDKSVESMFLDFAYECRLGESVHVQRDYFPADFLLSLGQLGLGVTLSLFPSLSETNEE